MIVWITVFLTPKFNSFTRTFSCK